ncbi:response regulator transcription factor [Paenibacillus sp. EC2-1]|uniref:response regulator transcription factor n=1 Tax=Paenibacillus sp. EC2-1 TaxID=3388665 RepID=UPI003BEF18E0
MKILLVEDDNLLNAVISKGLRKLGYAVDCSFDGEEALRLYEINSYDLIVLDLNLPIIDGIEVLKTIRHHDHEMKVIILSARSEVEDKIMGLDTGANDYIVKPFDFLELEARIRNLLRRSFVQQSTTLTCGLIAVETSKRLVIANDMPVDLTKKEYSILEYLMNHKDKVISMEEIIEHIWDSEADMFSNTFKFHIHSLKKKLSVVLGEDVPIINIRGQGYMISSSMEGGNCR